MERKTLLLMSGGMESTAALAWLIRKEFMTKKNLSCIFFNYGQPWVAEYRAAKAVCKHYGVGLIAYEASMVLPQKWNPRTSTGIYIAGRNTLLIYHALNLGYYRGYDRVVAGLESGGDYTDVGIGYINVLKLLSGVEFSDEIILYFPFESMTARDVYKWGVENDVPYELTYSCAAKALKACGECIKCKNRIGLLKHINGRVKV